MLLMQAYSQSQKMASGFAFLSDKLHNTVLTYQYLIQTSNQYYISIWWCKFQIQKKKSFSKTTLQRSQCFYPKPLSFSSTLIVLLLHKHYIFYWMFDIDLPVLSTSLVAVLTSKEEDCSNKFIGIMEINFEYINFIKELKKK